MVHALREAWRVLRADGALMDLRPAIQHGQVGLIRDEGFTVEWAMRESLAPQRAASRSLRIAQDLGLFEPRHSARFSCTMISPSPEHLRDWLYDWYERESLRHADDLARQVEEAGKQPELAGVIVAKIPFALKVLEKRNVLP